MSDNIIDFSKYQPKHGSSNVPLRKWQRDVMNDDYEKEMAFSTNSYAVGAADYGYSSESTDLVVNSLDMQNKIKKFSEILANDWINILRSVEKTHNVKTKVSKVLFTSTLVSLVFAGSDFVIKNDIIPFLKVPEYNLQNVQNWLRILGGLPLSSVIGAGGAEYFDKHYVSNSKNNYQSGVCEELVNYVNSRRIEKFLLNSVRDGRISENIDDEFCNDCLIAVFGMDNFYLILEDKNLYKKLCQTINNVAFEIYDFIHLPEYGHRNYRGR